MHATNTSFRERASVCESTKVVIHSIMLIKVPTNSYIHTYAEIYIVYLYNYKNIFVYVLRIHSKIFKENVKF